MLDWNESIIRRYGGPGPRYTSYPTAPNFKDSISENDITAAIDAGNANRRPLSLYTHVPFCDTVCFYCACNRIITANKARGAAYLDDLEREISLRAEGIDPARTVEQLHFGGGTPTFFDDSQLARVMGSLGRHFSLRTDDGGDYAIEIDPRTVDRERLMTIRGLGFNRVSLGVQDLNPLVQKAVNRVQPFEMIRDTVAWSREAGFHSINVDLICGLPLQTESTLMHSLDRLLPLRPDRISMYSYAHLPGRFKVQRQIDESTLPSPAEKVRMISRAGTLLQDSGYRFIGMDHFALEDDAMAQAQRSGKLHRNFQGYTLHGDTDLLGFGVSAISDLGCLYLQNEKRVEPWKAPLDAGRLPISRGYRLDPDDEVRRDVIMRLLCDLELDTGAVESRWNIAFDDYFREALEAWRRFSDEGLTECGPGRLSITDQGRLVSRALVQAFDAHVGATRQEQFSRVL